jgi:phage terminase small subunit
MPVLDNARHELFAQELAKGKTADEAYQIAGYSPNRGNACTLKAKQSIQDRVAEIMEAAAERAEITRADVLNELGKIGFSDIRRFFTPSGSLKGITDLDDEAAAAISSVEVVTKKSPGGQDNEVEHVAKIKTWDKRAALVDIAKMQGWLVDKHEHTGKDGGPIQTEDLSDTDVVKRMLFLIERAKRQQPTAH